MEIVKIFLTFLFSSLYKLVYKNKTVVLLSNPYGKVTGHIKCCYYLLKKERLSDIYIINHKGNSRNELTRLSIKTFILLLKSKTIIYTHNPKDIFPVIPKGVKKVNIWHGMPIKPIGYKSKVEQIWIKNKEKNNLSPYLKNDLLIVNSFYWVNFFSQSWQFPKSRILPLGSIVAEYLKIFKHKITKDLSSSFSNKKKYIIFAPTFRNNASDSDYINDVIILFSKLKSFNFIIKLHPQIKLNFDENYANIFFPINYDLFDLFLISDLLITDYSSVFHEYLLVKSHCILFQPDRKEYEKINGKLHKIGYESNIYITEDILTLKAKILFLMDNFDTKKVESSSYFDIDEFIKKIS